MAFAEICYWGSFKISQYSPILLKFDDTNILPGKMLVHFCRAEIFQIKFTEKNELMPDTLFH
jgi:hypothetical protein